MAARALAAAAAGGRRLAGQTGFPLLASCRRGAQAQNYSSSAQAQREEQKAVHDDGAASQVEAALNRKNVEVLPEETVDALEGDAAADAWVPDQETGVFAPADEASGTENLNHGAAAGGSSVLDQAVFVREEDMEDVERPAVDMATADHKAK